MKYWDTENVYQDSEGDKTVKMSTLNFIVSHFISLLINQNDSDTYEY